MCYSFIKIRVINIIALSALVLSFYSFNAQSQITTGPIVGSPFCACDSVDVPFTSVGPFIAGNVYTAELSDAAGTFGSPVIIGTLTDTANSGTIKCMLPCGSTTAAVYLIRVTSSTPAVTGSSNGLNIVINASVIPSVSIAAAVSGIICTDTTVIFTASPTNGGATPSYQWQINGVNVGIDSAVYTTSALLNIGDIVSVILTSNAACASPSIAQIDTVINCVIITTGALTASSFCACDTIDIPFSSTGTITAGNTYTGEVSDSAGSFAAPVTIGTLVSTSNSGTISCVIPCGSLAGTGYLFRVVSSSPPAIGTDNGLNIIVNPVVVPSVSITTTATTALCINTAVTFTATSLNGGTLPTYQWQRNSINVGANSPVYTSSGAFMNGETISVILTSNAACATPTAQQTNIVIACPAIEIPNVFTPNGDGINDVFKINLSGESLTNFNVSIYDRWGILVFASSSINNKWDGRTTSGLKVECGTYFYVLDLNSVEYKGHVTVLE
ncbi:MAG: gliding motility-associated C-terminal domain-containing protein [Bacteroidota bacterium]